MLYLQHSTRTAILSASLDTHKGKKKTLFPFHIIKVSLPYLSLSQGNKPTTTTLLHAAQHQRMRGQRLHPEARRQSHRTGEERPHSLPPMAQQIPIYATEILILLSKHIWGLHASVIWLTALVSEGLALCTPNVRPQPDDCLSVCGLLSERWVMWEDGRGWERAEEEEGSRGKVLPQESENLIWLPQRGTAAAAAATASAFSLRHRQTLS